ncbi:hypothetical protein HanIR_Chr11g0542961 [Helianthus annuus]|nr:hypothetical protein HanIR_Chr11g0542961 [Helianthus annuus]
METYHRDRSDFLTLTINSAPSFLNNDLTNGTGVIPLPRQTRSSFIPKSFIICQNPYANFKVYCFYQTYFLPYNLFHINHIHEILKHTLNVLFPDFQHFMKCYPST